jgi:hypothetical protein
MEFKTCLLLGGDSDMLKLKILKPDENGFVKVKRHKRCRRTYKWRMRYDEAIAQVREGGATVIGENTIYKWMDNKQVRLQVLKRDKYLCHYCGSLGDTVDHIVPVIKGGYSTPKNLVCSCKNCNQRKSGKDYEEFLNELNR